MITADLKEKLAKGQVIFGPFFKINAPNMAEMFGYAGFDFIIVDNEHSNFSYAEIENVIRAADGVNLHSIIRIPSASEEHILHALDSGASGVQIPSLSTAEQAKEAMPYTKYYPQGKRGMNTAQRAANFGFMEKNAFFKASNENTLVVVHVENKEMVDQIEALCQIPEIDVLFIGTGDLSQSIGKPMQVNDPEVVALVEKVFAAAAKHKKYVGIFAGNIAAAEKYIGMGAQFIGYSNDVTMITDSMKAVAKDFNQLRDKLKRQ
jgi:2,4-dihydroxyhept-2-ene-1,7-dioic acid aldolase